MCVHANINFAFLYSINNKPRRSVLSTSLLKWMNYGKLSSVWLFRISLNIALICLICTRFQSCAQYFFCTFRWNNWNVWSNFYASLRKYKIRCAQFIRIRLKRGDFMNKFYINITRISHAIYSTVISMIWLKQANIF